MLLFSRRAAIAQLFALVLCAHASADEWFGIPKLYRPNLTVSRQTTYFTGPRWPDGTIDYAAALHQKYSRGIDPKKNAVAAAMDALGPRPLDKYSCNDWDHKEFFERLGRSTPPEDGSYFVECGPYSLILIEANGGFGNPAASDIQDRFWKQRDHSPTVPWKAKDYPELAGWLTYNKTPLDKFAESLRLPQCYIPVLGGPDARLADRMGPLTTILLEISRTFCLRALLRSGEGQWELAIQDLDSVRRLARLFASGSYFVDLMFAHAIDQQALKCTAAIAGYAELPIQQAVILRDWIEKVPRLPQFTPRHLEGERVLLLSEIQHLTYSRYRIPKAFMTTALWPFVWKEELYWTTVSTAAPCVEWDEVLLTANQYCDEFSAVFLPNSRAERMAAFKLFQQRWATRSSQFREDHLRPCIAAFDSRHLREYFTEHVVTAFFDDSPVNLFVPFDRTAARYELARLALSLAAFHREKSSYPARLTELVPNHLKAIPLDPFTGQSFVFRRDGQGYVLYSVGHDEKDDAGDDLTDIVVQTK